MAKVPTSTYCDFEMAARGVQLFGISSSNIGEGAIHVSGCIQSRHQEPTLFMARELGEFERNVLKHQTILAQCRAKNIPLIPKAFAHYEKMLERSSKYSGRLTESLMVIYVWYEGYQDVGLRIVDMEVSYLSCEGCSLLSCAFLCCPDLYCVILRCPVLSSVVLGCLEL